MNRRLIFDFQKKRVTRSARTIFSCMNQFSVCFILSYSLSLFRVSAGLEPPVFVQHLRSFSISVQHLLVLKLGRDAHIDDRAVSAIPVELKVYLTNWFKLVLYASDTLLYLSDNIISISS